MFRLATTLALALALAPLSADEKAAAKKPFGTWTREATSHRLTFTFKADGVVFAMKDGDGNTVTASGDYAVAKDGTLFGVLTKVEKTGANGPEKGDLFGFAFDLTAEEMTISNLKGTNVSDDARKLVEGAYKKAAK